MSEADQRGVIFPSSCKEPVYFLFTLAQIIQIIKNISIRPVPFSPPCVKGIAQWRGQLLPVICPEECVGLKDRVQYSANRLIVIQTQKGKGIFTVSQTIRMICIPKSCTPVSPKPWLENPEKVLGVYKYDKKIFILADMENILGFKEI